MSAGFKKVSFSAILKLLYPSISVIMVIINTTYYIIFRTQNKEGIQGVS
jgi:hypothetical protein